ncbi:hypothetical protein M426DRAFT_21265 [Hypoxylon sp. CI-4A]|nr:hypothetical protein M426DRAFT_21265 [Hypoxylon sp. CI-4A]
MSLEQPHLADGSEDGRSSMASRKVNKESCEQARRSFASYTTGEDDLPDVLTDIDEPCVVEEATVMDAREITIETPKVPEKSALRASRFLDNPKRNSISISIKTTTTATDPHDIYLSSEEDASSSADDFSDYGYDASSDESEKSPVRRRPSPEVTARAVSVVFVGKPCVVDLASGRRSVSPIRRPRSISSSPANSFNARPSHPPRKSSLASTIDLPKESPSFLNQDPFAASNYKLESTREIPADSPSPRLPRTPTAAFQRFQKSLSLVRKRSRPNLKDAASRDSFVWPPASASITELSLASNSSRTSEEEQLKLKPTRRETLPAIITTQPPAPVTYNDIMMSARRDSLPRVLTKQPPAPPMSPSPMQGKKSLLSGLNINRRRSMRIKP